MQKITNKDIYFLERDQQGFDFAPTYLYQG